MNIKTDDFSSSPVYCDWDYNGTHPFTLYHKGEEVYFYVNKKEGNTPFIYKKKIDSTPLVIYPEAKKSKISGLLGMEVQVPLDSDYPAPHFTSEKPKYEYHSRRWYGSVATFFQPFLTSENRANQFNLRLPAGKSEYTIAADYTRSFNEINIDRGSKTIYEPTIYFRHIFHVKDGKEFADRHMATKEKNDKYVKSTQRTIMARAGMDFQVRFEHPVPVNNYAKSNYYYKADRRYYFDSNWNDGVATDTYKRVCAMDLEVTNLTTGEKYTYPYNEAADPNHIFYMAEKVTGEGYRTIDGVDYNLCAGKRDNPEQSYYRMLYANNAHAKGKYLVKLIGRDENNEVIKISNGSDWSNLYVMAYLVDFVSDMEASVLTETQLYDLDKSNNDRYESHRPRFLEQAHICGKPYQTIDFDEYRNLENLTNPENYLDRWSKENVNDRVEFDAKAGKYRLRWALPWNQVNYAWFYGDYWGGDGSDRSDYNAYCIASHSDMVAWHVSADEHVNDITENPDADPSGLYDRLFYETNGKQHGYFFYVNAATDPGVMSRLRIDNLCPGSSLAVSAWAAEMSPDPEAANFAFNFIAVDHAGNRQTLHSFVSGYIDNYNYGSGAAREKGKTELGGYYRCVHDNTPANGYKHGQWMHIYYSFIPDLSRIEMSQSEIDHFELEIENNCRSSQGADYAIDDIRLYVVNPEIVVTQRNPICDKEATEVDITVGMRFESLLQSMGYSRTDQSNEERLTVYYTLVDKKKFDNAYNGGEGDYDTAFESARLTGCYNSASGSDQYGKITFSTYFDSNGKYADTDISRLDKEEAFGIKTENGEEWIFFDARPKDDDMQVGKSYYLAICLGTGTASPSASDFQLGLDGEQGGCPKYSVFTIQGNGVIKVDGVEYGGDDPIEVCVGQAPVVQIHLRKHQSKGNVRLMKARESDYFDWYLGLFSEFEEERNAETNKSLYGILSEFRAAEPYLTEVPSELTDALKLNGRITQSDLDYLRKLTLSSDGAPARLQLRTSSYVLLPLDIDAEKECYTLTAFPIVTAQDLENLYCSTPTEVKITVSKMSPTMKDGFREGIAYPDHIVDVPLRISLDQLGSVSVKNGKVTDANPGGELKSLEIPLRAITSASSSSRSAVMRISDRDLVYLVGSNDPNYRKLDGHYTDDGLTRITSGLSDPDLLPVEVEDLTGEGETFEGMLPIGHLKGLTAMKKNGVEGEENLVKIIFSKDMKFREGYYYTLRFDFMEDLTQADDYSSIDGVENLCNGQLVFTIKVVPAYQKWTGVAGQNWNNDANWSRVVADDILYKEADADFIGKYLVSDANRQKSGYAPLDFTRVVIPDINKEKDSSYSPKGYMWMFDSYGPTPVEVATFYGNKRWSSIESRAGADDPATTDVKYDMASIEASRGGNNVVGCRPWYANTCREIHFNFGSEMIHQEYFLSGENYQKAWADMEMKAGRWYTLGSPLQDTYSGDMYLPSPQGVNPGGVQDTELFTDIRFIHNADGSGLNDRFNPAVYQRGWDRSSATVYEMDGSSKEAAVTLNWSQVYNDVKVDYSGGKGYSIYSDIEETPLKDGDNNTLVRFRLPKADTEYQYWDETGRITNTTHSVSRANSHKLNEFSNGTFICTIGSASATNEFFLVGNPFMSSLDVKKFLEENSGTLYPGYWILQDELQGAMIWTDINGDESYINAGADGLDGRVAPMQGFFVKTKKPGSSVTLRFTPAMLCEDGQKNASTPLKSPVTRSEAHHAPKGVLGITAIQKGKAVSSAAIRIDATSTSGYDSDLDAPLLADPGLRRPAGIYTVADGRGMTLNSIPTLSDTEIGLSMDEDLATTLRFEGVDNLPGVLLYDSFTGVFMPIEEGMEYEVEGAAHGRLYLTAGTEETLEEAMALTVDGNIVTISCYEEGVNASVFSSSGILEGNYSDKGHSLSFELTPGVHIIRATSPKGSLTRKLIVR